MASGRRPGAARRPKPPPSPPSSPWPFWAPSTAPLLYLPWYLPPSLPPRRPPPLPLPTAASAFGVVRSKMRTSFASRAPPVASRALPRRVLPPHRPRHTCIVPSRTLSPPPPPLSLRRALRRRARQLQAQSDAAPPVLRASLLASLAPPRAHQSPRHAPRARLPLSPPPPPPMRRPPTRVAASPQPAAACLG